VSITYSVEEVASKLNAERSDAAVAEMERCQAKQRTTADPFAQ